MVVYFVVCLDFIFHGSCGFCFLLKMCSPLYTTLFVELKMCNYQNSSAFTLFNETFILLVIQFYFKYQVQK